MTQIQSHPLVQESMQDFLKKHAQLKYNFFGGKGGVGKTVLPARPRWPSPAWGSGPS